jgi:MFS family permease
VISGPSAPLGLRANWRQFALLVVVNALVGAMVGQERAILPILAEHDFGLASRTAILSFIVSFGLVKAVANLLAGRLSDRLGRKAILVAGWVVGLPVPFLIMMAPSWPWVVVANILLGINQGLCWSTTVIMKVDLVGPRRRGLAMGLNEAAGYGAVSLAALATGYAAVAYGLRPQPFVLGVLFAAAGLLLSAVWVRESQQHAREEALLAPKANQESSFIRIVQLTSWGDRSLFASSQAGMVNNLNDGMAWGLFPLYFAGFGLDLAQIGILAAAYPAVWAITQLGTGALSDRIGRKGLIVGGMWLQAAALAALILSEGFGAWLTGMALLGLGTAAVYPTLLAAVSDVAYPEWRASAVGVYRLWRDLGYAVGAVLAGVVADLLGLTWAIGAVGFITLISGTIVLWRMYETLPGPRAAN